MSRVSRRKFLYAGVGVAAAAGISFLTKDYWLPYPESTPITTPTISPTITETSIPIETTSTISNPVVVEYGNKLPASIVNRLEPLGYDGINENERKLLDMLYELELNKDKIENNGFNAEKLENNMIDAAVENQTVSQDSAVTLDFMRNNISDVQLGVINHGFEYHFNYLKQFTKREDINKINPDFVFEMANIKELRQDYELSDLILNLYDQNKHSFDNMLNEGIKGKRRICTPLEAISWICLDEGESKAKTMLKQSVITLVNEAWKNTTLSNRYTSDRWIDFDEVSNRLISPKLVEKYMRDNLTYAYTKGELEGVRNVENIFNSKMGACYDHSLFAAYCLKKNGYEAKGMHVEFKKLLQNYFSGHVVCLYRDPKDDMFYTIDVWNLKNEIFGPFKNAEDAAESSCHGQGLKSYETHEIDLEDGRYLTRWIR